MRYQFTGDAFLPCSVWTFGLLAVALSVADGPVDKPTTTGGSTVLLYFRVQLLLGFLLLLLFYCTVHTDRVIHGVQSSVLLLAHYPILKPKVKS